MAKATFQVNDTLLIQAKQAVAQGFAKSLSNLVENALRDLLEKFKEEQIKQALQEASKDPLFLSDIKEVSRDFAPIDYEEAAK